jgi:hypothetical protein
MYKKTKEPPKEGKPLGNYQVLEIPFVAGSISNNEKEKPLKRTPNLKEPSPPTTTSLKINTIWA